MVVKKVVMRQRKTLTNHHLLEKIQSVKSQQVITQEVTVLIVSQYLHHNYSIGLYL